MVGSQRHAGREGKDCLLILPALVGTLAVVEVRPKALRLQVDRAFKVSSGFEQLTGSEQRAPQGVMLPGGLRWLGLRLAGRCLGAIRQPQGRGVQLALVS